MDKKRTDYPVSVRIRPKAREALWSLRKQPGGFNLSRTLSDWLVALERIRRDEKPVVEDSDG